MCAQNEKGIPVLFQTNDQSLEKWRKTDCVESLHSELENPCNFEPIVLSEEYDS